MTTNGGFLMFLKPKRTALVRFVILFALVGCICESRMASAQATLGQLMNEVQLDADADGPGLCQHDLQNIHDNWGRRSCDYNSDPGSEDRVRCCIGMQSSCVDSCVNVFTDGDGHAISPPPVFPRCCSAEYGGRYKKCPKGQRPTVPCWPDVDGWEETQAPSNLGECLARCNSQVKRDRCIHDPRHSHGDPWWWPTKEDWCSPFRPLGNQPLF